MKKILFTAGLVAIFLLASGNTITYSQVSIGFRLQFGDQERGFNRYYTDLAEYYHTPYHMIYEMHRAGIPDQDMPIILYLTVNSKYSLRHIYALRARGATWAQLSMWCNVPLYFDNHGYYYRHEGPPYGNAYGHYKNKKDKKNRDYVYYGYYYQEPYKTK